MAKRVYLYAFDSLCRIVNCKYLEEEAISVTNVLRLAEWMAESLPISMRVYAVDNRPGLYQDFREAIDLRDFTKQLAFADMISREGIRIK